MNIKYTLGNTVKNKTRIGGTGYLEYKFPTYGDSCEWSSGEVRSYENYIRPIGNLFDNDRMLKKYCDDLFEGITKVQFNCVVNGCKVLVTDRVVGTVTRKIAELAPGLFVHNKKIYCNSARCEMTCRQIENSLMQTKGEPGALAHICFIDGKYSGEIISADGTKYTVSDKTTAVEFLLSLNSKKEFIENTVEGFRLTDYLLVPMFDITDVVGKDVCYIGTEISVTNYVDTYTSFGTCNNGIITEDHVRKFGLSGDLFGDRAIKTIKLEKDSITIGDSEITLGDIVSNLSGVGSYNGLGVEAENSRFELSSGSGRLIVDGKNITLNNAAGKDYTDEIRFNITDENKVPTVKGLKDMFNFQSITFGKDVNISAGLNLVNGLNTKNVTVTDPSFATMSVGDVTYTYIPISTDNVSCSGAEVVDGGLAVKQNIFAAGDIKGRNVQSVSSEAAKENFSNFNESALDIINSVKLYSYNYKNDKEHYKIGIKAEETHPYISTEERNVLDHANSIALLFKAVQELSAENKLLREELNEIKSSRS